MGSFPRELVIILQFFGATGLRPQSISLLDEYHQGSTQASQTSLSFSWKLWISTGHLAMSITNFNTNCQLSPCIGWFESSLADSGQATAHIYSSLPFKYATWTSEFCAYFRRSIPKSPAFRCNVKKIDRQAPEWVLALWDHLKTEQDEPSKQTRSSAWVRC
jgi:hypothetical protein